MKFGDKLIKLRKKKGLSQEELAEKLNVSRQSVSKWESNNTYPETDKIVQICNIFDCSMDDLINDKITDIEKRENTEKRKYQIIVDSFLDFIVRTINLFTSMKFMDIIKCLIELLIISLILFAGGLVFVQVSEVILNSLFSFLGPNASNILINFIDGLLTLIWIVISLIIIIHIFTIRYLNYYDEFIEKKAQEDKKDNLKEEKDDIKIEKKIAFKEQTPKIIFRDKGYSPLAFLTFFSKIALGILKVIGMFFLVGGLFLLFGLIVSLTLFLFLAVYSDLFKGISLIVFGLIALIIIAIYFLGSFILNKKIVFKITVIAFGVAFLITALGTGFSILSLKDIEFKEENTYVKKKELVENLIYQDRMFIDFFEYTDTVNYIVDNSLMSGDIKITLEYDAAFQKLDIKEDNYYDMTSVNITTYQFTDTKELVNIFIKDLKRNVLSNYASLKIDNIKVIANEETINKLLDNYAKVYLFEKFPLENGYLLKTSEEKVHIDDYYCRIDYDIYSDTITVLQDNCFCNKEIIETSNGNKNIYRCDLK